MTIFISETGWVYCDTEYWRNWLRLVWQTSYVAYTVPDNRYKSMVQRRTIARPQCIATSTRDACAEEPYSGLVQTKISRNLS